MAELTSLQDQFLNEIEAEQNKLNQLIQKLIQIKSYSGEEKEIVKFILEKMNEFKFEEMFSDGFGNVVGRIGSGAIKILFDAHIDTVKATEAENWLYPPFAGKIIKGKIYGRGAVDEKPAMAGYLLAGKMMKKYAEEVPLPFTLYIVGSVLEEDADGYPLFHLINNEGIKPDYVLLGEPTDLSVYRGQRGRMEIKINIKGKSAHGAHNQQGINAIYKMNPLIEAIEKMDKNLPDIALLGKGSITVSQIVSRSPSLCSVPDFCQLHLDRRLTLGETKESALTQLHDLAREKKIDAEIFVPNFKGISWKGKAYQAEAYFPTWLLDDDHVLTRAGKQTATQVLGRPAELGAWSFSTNGVATAGLFGIPTIGFAPGREELSHSAREELILNDLLTATKFYFLLPFFLCKLLNA